MFFVNISELCTTSFSLSQMNDSVDPALLFRGPASRPQDLSWAVSAAPARDLANCTSDTKRRIN